MVPSATSTSASPAASILSGPHTSVRSRIAVLIDCQCSPCISSYNFRESYTWKFCSFVERLERVGCWNCDDTSHCETSEEQSHDTSELHDEILEMLFDRYVDCVGQV
jgi:hypothetical protein